MPIISTAPFSYKPNDHESEKASNSYLMSVIALMVGMPLPVINLIATFIFFLGNRKATYFVRWHCMQALISQLVLFCMNSVGFSWTMSIIFGDNQINNYYVAYLLTLFLFNLSEFIVTIYTAIKTRKGTHVQWFFYGEFTNLICKA